MMTITSLSLITPRAPEGFVWGLDVRRGRCPEGVTNPHHCGRCSAPNLERKNGMAPESIDKDVCELAALEVACAMRAGLISAGAHSYR